MIDYQFLYAFSKDVLNLAESIIWVGITNKFGVLLNVEQRQRSPFLTEEEQEEYVSNSITRDKKIRFESKIGKQIYAFGKYKKLNRATIPMINNGYYMLLIFDSKAADFDEVIMKKIVPLTDKERHDLLSLTMLMECDGVGVNRDNCRTCLHRHSKLYVIVGDNQDEYNVLHWILSL